MKKGIKILLFLYFINKLAFGQLPNIEFEHLTTKDGLSNNAVTSIIQDSSGFMWFGTNSGLNRWDGYEFKIFSNNPFDSNSISSDHVFAIYKDSFGTLWIGTEHGLNKFDIQTEKFTRYITHHDSIDFITQNRVTCIIEDDSSNIWYSTECGICRLNTKTGRTERFLEEPKDADPPANIIYTLYKIDKERMLVGSVKRLLDFNFKSNNFTAVNQLKKLYLEKYLNVNTILIDRKKKLWLGTERGLLKLKFEGNGFEQYVQNPEEPFALSSTGVIALHEDKRGRFWIGTHNGLNLMDRNLNKFISYWNDKYDLKSISSLNIHKIFEDKDQNLWIGSRDKGINIIFNWQKPFKSFIHQPDNLEGLGYGEVTAIVEDKSGDVWVAQFGGGLNRQNIRSGNFEHYYNLPNSRIMIGNSFVQELYEDKEGNIWVGSVGLDCINPKTNSVSHYDYNPEAKNGIGGFAINLIYEDKKGILWLGCVANGLDRFDKNNGTFEHFKYNPLDSTSICNNQVLSICQDSRENLWIGTVDGLCKLIYLINNKTGFKQFKNSSLNSSSISNNIVYKIFEDSKNRLWIGTEYGLNLFDYEKEKFSCFTTENGLPSNCIYSIQEDNSGHLWLRTDKGIVKFNFEKHLFRTYDERDDLPDCKTIELGYKAFYKGRSGKFYYGGQSSLTVFYPDSIKDNPNPPPIVLTNFKMNNKSVKINENSYLKRDINYISSIILPFKENVFSIEFASLDYTTPAKNQYAYKLVGFNKSWTFTDAAHRVASFTNLDPGEYTFRIIGSNSDGVWNKIGASLNILILPPWWATWWFRAIAIVFFLSGLILLYKLRISHLKSEKIRQEEFSKKLIESLEGERKRIAGELHDSLGQNLMIIYHELQQYSQRKEIAPNELKSLFPEVKETIEEVREIARNLHPHQLEQLGLTKAVRSIVRKLSGSTKINCNSDIEFIDEFIQQDLWIHVYRIFQEALTNIIKHSGANEVKIAVKKDNQNIFILIEDNGKGIHSIIEKTNNGFGLENMKERARLLKAKLEISSPLQKGVKVLMYIPIK